MKKPILFIAFMLPVLLQAQETPCHIIKYFKHNKSGELKRFDNDTLKVNFEKDAYLNFIFSDSMFIYNSKAQTLFVNPKGMPPFSIQLRDNGPYYVSEKDSANLNEASKGHKDGNFSVTRRIGPLMNVYTDYTAYRATMVSIVTREKIFALKITYGKIPTWEVVVDFGNPMSQVKEHTASIKYTPDRLPHYFIYKNRTSGLETTVDFKKSLLNSASFYRAGNQHDLTSYQAASTTNVIEMKYSEKGKLKNAPKDMELCIVKQ